MVHQEFETSSQFQLLSHFGTHEGILGLFTFLIEEVKAPQKNSYLRDS
jgi:hypothetical protein